jgi:hypothetical protein
MLAISSSDTDPNSGQPNPKSHNPNAMDGRSGSNSINNLPNASFADDKLTIDCAKPNCYLSQLLVHLLPVPEHWELGQVQLHRPKIKNHYCHQQTELILG